MTVEVNLPDDVDLQSDDDTGVPAAHNKLLGAVSQLYEKKRVKAPTRKEPSLEVSEFHLSQPVKKRGHRVKVTDLAQALNTRAVHAEISQKLRNAQKRAKTLPKPLEQIHADKITREAGYELAKRRLNRWDAIVYQQKVAEQLTFPLQSETIKVHEETTDLSKLLRKPTDLMLSLAEKLKHPKPFLRKQEEEQEEEKKNEAKEEDYPLSLAEVIEKRKMMAKLRAQQSYKQAKAMRHSKIKSKKFHQIQRRSRVKEQLKEFEELQKKDPEAALKKLEELERTRAEERVTLRHRSTGQWAKNLAVRAKYDKDARIALAEQLSKSRELTVKLAQNKDSESEKEDEGEDVQPEPEEEDPNNPWVVKQSKEMEDFVSGYRKYWETKSKEMETRRKDDTAVSSQVEEGKAEEKESSNKNNNRLQSESKGENVDSQSENSQKDPRVKHICTEKVCENVDLNSVQFKSSSTQNKFIVNSAKSDKNKVENNMTLSTFNVILGPVKKKNINALKLMESKVLSKENKIKCKSGSWTVTKTVMAHTGSSSKKSKKAGNKNENKTKEDRRLSGNFKVTETETSSDAKTTCDKTKRELIKNTVQTRESKNQKPQKLKSLDELFEEVEDKLQDRIKDKFEKVKASLNHKRKNDDDSDVDSEADEVPSLELKKRKITADVDEELFENTVTNSRETVTSNFEKTLATASAQTKSVEDIDPNKFLKVTPRRLLSKVPEIMDEGEDALDDEETSAQDRHLTISEAFAEDDVVDQFQKDKEEEVKKNAVGDVDLTLPGWGSWAGHNMRPVSRRKRKKFVIKFPRVIPRRDTNRGNVIINEDADKPLKEHQVSELPFPFTSVKEYEATIRAPLGSTWVPQTAHRKLTLAPIVTKLGAVIQPMDEDQLISRDTSKPTWSKARNKKKHKK